jgi:enamine deaminase RidA (YjgF/YER057c/UK114 family)
MEIKRISSGSPWETIVGYSRAIRNGQMIEVSGTTATVNGEVVHKGDVYGQTKTILTIIQKAIEDAGGTLNDIVRTRMYVTDISRWQEAAKAHAEVFCEIRPATTMVEVSKLIDPDHLIEIEATAIITVV